MMIKIFGRKTNYILSNVLSVAFEPNQLFQDGYHNNRIVIVIDGAGYYFGQEFLGFRINKFAFEFIVKEINNKLTDAKPDSIIVIDHKCFTEEFFLTEKNKVEIGS